MRSLWTWEDAITLDGTARPIVAIWPRGRGKSTTAETIAADLGVRKARRYVMYVSGTQDQADKHVQTIARMLELDSVATYAPEIGHPKVSSNGNRQWNRQILSASGGRI
jgi:cytidylate kinase